MNAPDQCLKKLDTVYDYALRFITGCGNLVHHCTLYAATKLGCFLLICVHTCVKTKINMACALMIFNRCCPRVRTELDKKAFKYAAPSSWNKVQKDLKLSELITMGDFKSILKD